MMIRKKVSILLVILTALALSSCTPKNYSLANKTWDAYIVHEKEGDTTNNYFITNTFNSDGTFTETHKSRDYSKIEQSYKKTWELINNVLVVTLTRNSDGTRRTTKYSITWLNESTFYTVDENEETSVETYVYYYAR